MDFRVQKVDLVRVLLRAAAAAAAKSDMPSLTCVLITAEKNGRLTVAGTNNVVTIRAHCNCQVKIPGAIAVSAKSIAEVARNLPAGEAHFAIAKSGKKTTEALVIKSGKSKNTVPFIPGDDFPGLPKPGDAAALTVQSSALARIMSQVAWSQCTDDQESRQFINCVLLTAESSELTAVATDGTRNLAIARMPGTFGEFCESVARRAVSEVMKLCADDDGDVSISSTGDKLSGYLHFMWEGVTLSVRKIGTDFQTYKSLVKDEYPINVELAREPLIAAIKRVSVAHAEGIVCTLRDGEFALFAEAGTSGQDAEDALDVSYSGKEVTFKLAPDPFATALAVMHDDAVVLSLRGADQEIVLRGAKAPRELHVIIMPMRV